ncbi:hypothetical protein OKZ62_001772 [Vibrio navarrensis]|nr:hypothetical protein [Vibrio navarrensis]
MDCKLTIIALTIFVVLGLIKKLPTSLYPSNDDVKKNVFDEGIRARRSNLNIEANPYNSSLLKAIWVEGWKTEDERKSFIKSKN